MRPLKQVALCPKRAFVLIVEDENEQLEELALALELAGIPVMCANNGPAALDLLAQHEELCIVIVGWRMSGMSGANLMSALKDKLRPTRPIAVIALSGAWTEIEERTATELGAVACIHKPYSVSTVTSAIDVAVAQVNDMSRQLCGTALARLLHLDFLDDTTTREHDSAGDA